ncbi:MAG: hypothetical protein K6B46_01650 [Opitutales bacterium]|nr:hypothetical protein [Opitutales bacterium]
MQTYKISREWLNRMGLIFFFLLGSSAWFFYDGLVTYPRDNAIFIARENLEKTYPDDPVALESAWIKIADENKYPLEKNDLPDHLKNIEGQFKWGCGVLCAAVLFLLFVLRDSLRKIKNDEESFTGITDRLAPFATLTTVKYKDVIGFDKARWDKKGIAKIIYKTSPDAPHRFVLVDDYKYSGSEDILKRCETVVEQKNAAKR